MADDKNTPMTGDGPGRGLAAVSPYYFHPSDNPGSLISLVQLKGENYEEWDRLMRNSLRPKKKLGFIDGMLMRPEDHSPDLEDWWMVNAMLVAGSSIRSNHRYDRLLHIWRT